MADLTNLVDVKEWLSTGEQPLGPRDDRLLARLITSASVFIETWVGRPIGLANWQEIRDGLGGERANRMVLAVNPITAILSLSIWGVPIPAAPAPSQQGWTSGYIFSPTELAVRGWRFARGTQNVVVQYTAGYDTIPADVQQACIELVARKYKERTRVGERTRSLGGAETVSYETVAFGRREDVSDIQVILQKYKMTPLLPAPTRLPDPDIDLVLEDGTTPQTVIELEDAVTPIEEET